MYGFLHTYSSENCFLFYFGWVQRYICFSHFSCEKQIYLCTHLKPSLAFLMVQLRVTIFFSYVFFTLSIIIITYTLSLSTDMRELDC
jgi:hypothetical protein